MVLPRGCSCPGDTRTRQLVGTMGEISSPCQRHRKTLWLTGILGPLQPWPGLPSPPLPNKQPRLGGLIPGLFVHPHGPWLHCFSRSAEFQFLLDGGLFVCVGKLFNVDSPQIQPHFPSLGWQQEPLWRPRRRKAWCLLPASDQSAGHGRTQSTRAGIILVLISDGPTKR